MRMDNNATVQLKAPSAAARPVPMMMHARASGSVRGRMAWIQISRRFVEVLIDVMSEVIAKSNAIR